MNHMKRMLALILALVMIVGVLPMSVLAAEETVNGNFNGGSNVLLDAAIFCSDVHGNPGTVTSVFNGIKSADSTFSPSTASFVGDTQTTASSVTSAAQGVFSGVQCIYAFGNHDDEGNYGIDQFTGLSYGSSSTNYYIYTISETSMGSSNPDTTGFTSTVAGLDKTKPLFIISHLPLHARRNDNHGAAAWYNAISAAAEEIDIFFFWAHNHTGDNSVDQAAYYVAKDGSETISIQGGSTVIPNFTYANAGYIDPPNKAARMNVATAVRIYSGSVNLTVYNASGELSGTYAVNETITREFAPENDPPKNLAVTGKTDYTVGDSIKTPSAVNVTYMSGTVSAAQDYSLTKITKGETSYTVDGFTFPEEGTYTLTYTCKIGNYQANAELKVTVEAAASSDTVTYLDHQITIQATQEGLTGIDAEYVYSEYDLSDIYSDYIAYDVTLEGYTGGDVFYSFLMVDNMDTTNLLVYHVSDDGTTRTPIAYELVTDVQGNQYVEFTTSLTGVFAYGSANVPEGYTASKLTMTGVPADTFKGNLDLSDAVFTVTYTKDGAEDFVRVLTANDWNYENFSFTDEIGEQTFTFTFDGVSASQTVYVWYDEFVVGGEVTVHVGAAEYGVSGANVAISSNGNVETAIVGVIKGDTYKAYDITLIYAEGYEANDDTKTVTLLIPEGVTNPVVYYVPASGAAESVTIVEKTATTITFETTHFSTYVVGEGAEEPSNEVTVGGTTTTTKTYYVLTSSISAGESYLIVNGDEAGSYNALANNNGSVAATDVIVQSGDIDGDGDNETYIELTDATDELWTTSGSSSTTLKNGSYYLGYTTSNNRNTFGLSATARTWSYSINSNRLSTSVSSGSGNRSTTYYLRYNSGWTWTDSSSASGRNVYFYVPTDITTTVDTTVKYTMRAESLKQVVDINNADTLTAQIDFCLQGNGTDLTTLPSGGSYSFTELSDTKNILTIGTDGTVTFSGTTGAAAVKVAYTWTQDGKTYTVYKNITIEASEPYYSLDLHKNNGGVLGEEITDTIAIKGVEEGDTYSVWAVITYFDGTVGGVDQGDVEDNMIEWTSSDPTIATVDPVTGIITFTGKEGTVNITATYQGGNKPSDTITISATASQYTVPNDGTDDFPEYPNEGAIRFDKTATAVGNFSETGITQIELSMTGVPYTTGSEMDVVIMLDQSTSMNDDRIEATVIATKAFIEDIVKNEDGSFNKNRIYVGYFNGSNTYDISDSGNIGGDLASIDSQDELDDLFDDIDNEFDGSPTAQGTQYAVALKKCYDRLNSAKTDGTGNDRQQFCVFMSDGVPTTYQTGANTMHGSASSTSEGYDDMKPMFTGTNYDTRSSSYQYEYYSTQMKAAGVTVYTVGLGLQATNSAWSGATAVQCLNAASLMLNDISGPGGETTQPDAKNTKTLSKKDNYFFSVADADAAEDMKNVFENIAMKILQAATDVTVEDKITDEYTMIFDIPEGTKDITGVTNDFYIEFLKYALDANHERTTSTSVTKLYLKNTNGVLSAASDANGTAYAAPVFAQTVIGDKGTLYYWTTDDTYASKAAVTYTNSDDTYYFIPYGMEANEDGTAPENWYNMTSGAYAHGTVDSTTNMSEDVVIATPYFVYNAATKKLYWTVDKLDNTEYVLRYFLYLDNSATEVGTGKEVDPGSYHTNEYAFLTYTNFQGEDCRQEMPVPQQTWSGAQVSYVFYLVNAAGQPINQSGQVVDFANAVFVTKVYTESTVWNKGEDGQITADSQLSINWLAEELLPSDYKVYDEKALYRLHVYGDHTGASIFDYFTIGGGTSDEILASLKTRLNRTDLTSASVSTTKVYNTKAGNKYSAYGTYTSKATDFYNNEIVLSGFDFYNTTVAFAVVWEPALAQDTVVVDFGLDVLINVTQNDLITDNTITGIGVGKDAYGNIAMNSGISTTSRLGTANLTIDGNTISIENDTQIRFHQGDMIFTKPVVFYYESRVEYYESSEPKNGYLYSQVTVIPATTIYYEDSFISDDDLHSYEWENNGWKDLTTGIGDGNFDWKLDGTAANATQAQDRPGTNQIAGVVDADNNYGYDAAYESMSQYSMGAALKVHVDYDHMATASFNFWGTGFDVISLTTNTTGTIIVNVYDSNDKQVKSFTVNTYYGMKYENGEWVATTPDDPNALYQVPVMKISGLTYGQYRAEIKVVYDPIFDQGLYENASYDFYLDAVRIYDPTGNQNSTANDAYVKDGEGWPTYAELRDLVIDAGGVTVGTDGKVTIPENAVLSGYVFIDGINGTNSVENYTNYGPNNELYLANGQSITFALNKNGTDFAKSGYEIDKVQLAIKSVGGSGKVLISYQDGNQLDTFLETDIKTATDMYYDITKLDGKTVVIQSTGDAIISLTNIKVTYKAAQTTAENGEPPVSVMSLSRAAVTEEAETYLISVNAEMIEQVLNILNGKVDPNRPVAPNPGKPSKPGNGNKPVVSKPSVPGKPPVPAKPVKPVCPIVPSKPANPVVPKPVNPGIPTIPGRPGPVVAVHIY